MRHPNIVEFQVTGERHFVLCVLETNTDLVH